MTEDAKGCLSRRSAFAAAGAGALIAASFGSRAQAAEMSDGEKANVKVVNALMAGFAGDKPDIKKMVEGLTDDCILHLEEGKPPIVGKEATIKTFEGFKTKGLTFVVDVHDTFAKGPVVAHYRVDDVISGGKKTASFALVGVFVLKGGKVHEWFDYIIKT